ncbi:MAG: hypothetical protein AB1798_17205, partial [Spirochaetota bacterium]
LRDGASGVYIKFPTWVKERRVSHREQGGRRKEERLDEDLGVEIQFRGLYFERTLYIIRQQG